MTDAAVGSYRATVEDYRRLADALFAALEASDEAAVWRVKWEHPRFRGQRVDDVRRAALEPADADMVVAREYGFEDWPHLATFADRVRRDAALDRFEAATDAVIAGDGRVLEGLIQAHPELVGARSARRHRATLLHYVAANGVEHYRQRTPHNAVEIARLLLDAGAEVDALADMYGAQCTTLSLVVSSAHPAEAGLQAALTETLLDHGAALDGPGSRWQSAVLTALAFGYSDTAEVLARRGASVQSLAAAAGLGRLDAARRLVEAADATERHVAMALAAQHGHTDVVRLLLDAGEDPSRYNPEGFHAHTTPLHQAVWSNHAEVVHLFVEHGADLTVRDTVYHGTPLDWAIHGQRSEIATYLRACQE